MKSIRKIVVVKIITCMIVCMSILVGCSKNGTNGNELTGGDIVKYSICVGGDDADDYEWASLPIISTKKIETLTLNRVELKEDADIEVTIMPFSKEDSVEYKDYYISFVMLELRCNQEKPINTQIEKIFFNVNGEEKEYKIPDLKVCNTKYLCGKDKSLSEEGTLIITGGLSLMNKRLPHKDHMAKFLLSSNKNITFKKFSVLDYANVDEFMMNNEKVDFNKINRALKKNEEIGFYYSLNYADGVDETNIVRCSEILTFEEDGLEKIWVLPMGIYVWPDFNKQSAVVERYIDTIL